MTDVKTARATIDSIMDKLKRESFNQLVIVIEYGRTSTDFYNHLEILERCLNGVVDSSVMLIINRAPNTAQCKKALKENPSFDLNKNLKRIRDEVARIFKFEFSADFIILEELENENDFKANDVILDKIRNVICLSESYQFSNAKTWSDLVKIVEDSQKANYDQSKINEQIKSDLKDNIEKIKSNISSIQKTIDWLDVGQSIMTGAEAVASFTKLKFLIPLFETGSTKLTETKCEKKIQLDRLNEEKESKEKLIIELEIDNFKLKEEIEKYRNEIIRLQKILREN